MTWQHVHALAPLLALFAGITLTLLVCAVVRSLAASFVLALATLACSFALIPATLPVEPLQATALLVVDGAGAFFMGVVLLSAAGVASLSFVYFRFEVDAPDELMLMLLCATLGGSVLAASSHFASLLLGLEILTVSLYGMIGFSRHRDTAVEAATKYLVLGAASTAVLAFGVGLVYFELGRLDFEGIRDAMSGGGAASGAIVQAGLGLIVSAVAFKLALVPFHAWTPDVYQGAPAPVTAFLAAVSKVAVVAVAVRLILPIVGENTAAGSGLSLLAAASMIGGNLLALRQDNVKRMLAGSSIAHLGYLLVPLALGGPMAREAVAFYAAAYALASLGAFGSLSVLSGAGREMEWLAEWKGLFWRRPVLSAMLATSLMSLAGIPLTVGFAGKLFVFAVGIRANGWVLVFVLALSSLLGVYYYLRVVVALYSPAEVADARRPTSPVFLPGTATLAALSLVNLAAGVWPAPFISLVRTLVS